MPNSLLSRTTIRKIGSCPLPAYPRHTYDFGVVRHIYTIKPRAKLAEYHHKNHLFHTFPCGAHSLYNTANIVPHLPFSEYFLKKMYVGVYSPDIFFKMSAPCAASCNSLVISFCLWWSVSHNHITFCLIILQRPCHTIRKKAMNYQKIHGPYIYHLVQACHSSSESSLRLSIPSE